MPYWVIEGLLARSSRPGYRPGSESIVPLDDVVEWVDEAKTFGVQSIMVLISDDQLPLYRRDLPQGLISYYLEAGFEVAHLPTYDGLSEPYTEEDYEAAWRAFQELPKPVLVHCSAGYDRTGRIVSHILGRLADTDGSLAADLAEGR